MKTHTYVLWCGLLALVVFFLVRGAYHRPAAESSSAHHEVGQYNARDEAGISTNGASAQKTREQDVEHPYQISGIVVDSSGTPQGHARLFVKHGSSSEQVRLSSGAEFRVTFSDAGRIVLIACASDKTNIASTVEVALTVNSPQSTVRITLEAAAQISGRVLASDGRLMPGARISVIAPAVDRPIESQLSSYYHNTFVTHSDQSGTYSLSSLRPCCTCYDPGHAECSKPYEIIAHSQSFRVASVKCHLLPGNNLIPELVLAPEPVLATITGIVVTDRGAPVGGAKIVICHVRNDDDGTVHRVPFTTRSSAEGTFTLAVSFPYGSEDTKHWNRLLVVEAKGHPNTVVPVEIHPGRKYPNYRIELERGVTITGQVFLKDGSVACGARLQVLSSTYPNFFEPISLKADERGVFSWLGSTSETYEISASYYRAPKASIADAEYIKFVGGAQGVVSGEDPIRVVLRKVND